MKVPASSLALALSALFVLYCGSTSPKNARDKRFIGERARKAKKLAPDLVARAQSAHDESLLAEERGETLAAQEYSTCAELLLEAAQIEAERVELERRRLSAQKRVDRANALQIRYRRSRQCVEREIALIEATQNAKRLDSFGFEETSEGGDKGTRSQKLQQTELERARLYLASAVAMGADTAMLEKARSAIHEAQNQSISSALSKLKAERALLSSLDALGAARAKNDGPTRDEITTLLNEAEKEGFSTEFLATGLSVKLQGPFIGSSAVLNDEGILEMKKLLYLVRAHPHGEIEIRLHAGSQVRPNRKRLAKARAARVISSLSRDKSQQARFKVVFDVFVTDETNLVKLVFLAYRRTAQ